MKVWPVLVMMGLGSGAMVSCTPPIERTEPEPLPPPIVTPTPPPTPHPAASAKERAVQLYPDLAVKDSLMNRTFLELVENHKERNPRLMTQVDWPITVANEAARMLGINPVFDKATPTPAPTPPPMAPPVVIYVTPRPAGSSLERGAYNSVRGVTSTPIIRHYRVP